MRILLLIFTLLLIGCSTALIKSNTFSPNPKDPIVSNQFETTTTKKGETFSQNKIENKDVSLNYKLYVYKEPVIITLIICGVTLISCVISGAFKK